MTSNGLDGRDPCGYRERALFSNITIVCESLGFDRRIFIDKHTRARVFISLRIGRALHQWNALSAGADAADAAVRWLLKPQFAGQRVADGGEGELWHNGTINTNASASGEDADHICFLLGVRCRRRSKGWHARALPMVFQLCAECQWCQRPEMSDIMHVW